MNKELKNQRKKEERSKTKAGNGNPKLSGKIVPQLNYRNSSDSYIYVAITK